MAKMYLEESSIQLTTFSSTILVSILKGSNREEQGCKSYTWQAGLAQISAGLGRSGPKFLRAGPFFANSLRRISQYSAIFERTKLNLKWVGRAGPLRPMIFAGLAEPDSPAQLED